MTTEKCRNLVIGSGVGGKVLAWNLAQRGEATVVIERSMIGGSCPNVACLPSKNVIYSAKVAALAHPTTGLGVLGGDVRVDMAGVVHRKRQMVQELVEIHLNLYRSSGVELVMGEARFTEPKTVEVTLNAGGSRSIRGERVFLSLGTRAMIPDVAGLAAAEPLTHVEALNLDRVPEHLVVLGGGYVGLEFAQAMRRFGSRVTVIQRGRQLLKREDADIARAVEELLRDEGIEVLLLTEVLEVTGRSGAGVTVRVRKRAEEVIVEASDILVAVGRTPNTDRVNLANAGVGLDSRGYVRVDERLQTTAADVWAMGECAGSPQFTHAGEDDFRVVLSNLDGGNRTTRGRLIPYCLFTDPELAHVGLTEGDARAAEISYRLITHPMAQVLRAYTVSQTRGFAKALIGTDDRILGFTAFGVEASEMMAVVQVAMLAGMPYTALRDVIFAHPTAAEGLGGMFTTTPSPPM